MLIHKYVDWNGSAATPATKRLAGVAPEVNLMILLHADDEACKQEIHPGFETHCRHHHNSQPGVSVAPQKRLMPFKNKKQLVLNNMYLFPILPIPGGRTKIHTILVSTISLQTDNFN